MCLLRIPTNSPQRSYATFNDARKTLSGANSSTWLAEYIDPYRNPTSLAHIEPLIQQQIIHRCTTARCGRSAWSLVWRLDRQADRRRLSGTPTMWLDLFCSMHLWSAAADLWQQLCWPTGICGWGPRPRGPGWWGLCNAKPYVCLQKKPFAKLHEFVLEHGWIKLNRSWCGFSMVESIQMHCWMVESSWIDPDFCYMTEWLNRSRAWLNGWIDIDAETASGLVAHGCDSQINIVRIVRQVWLTDWYLFLWMYGPDSLACQPAHPHNEGQINE